MVVLTSFSQPTEGIRHQQPNTTVFVNDNNLGKGTLYIAESCLSWIGDSGNGFSLEYPHISLHAISRDLTTFPQECLFLMLDTALDDESNGDDGEDEENESEDQGTTELRLVPDDRGMLDAMFHAMNVCQALHPDPEDSFSDEDFYEGDDDEIQMDETDSRMANLSIELSHEDRSMGLNRRIEDGVGVEEEEEAAVAAAAATSDEKVEQNEIGMSGGDFFYGNLADSSQVGRVYSSNNSWNGNRSDQCLRGLSSNTHPEVECCFDDVEN